MVESNDGPVVVTGNGGDVAAVEDINNDSVSIVSVDGDRLPVSLPIEQMVSFWSWFFRKENTKPGWKKLFHRVWTPLFLFVGAFLSYVVPGSIQESALSGILPLAAIFIGMAFAWSGNALALIQSSTFKMAARRHAGGVREYAFTFQLATLSLLFTVVIWGMGALGIFDSHNFLPSLYPVTKSVLFFVACVSLRECWQVMLAAQQMLIGADYLEQIQDNSKKPPEIDLD